MQLIGSKQYAIVRLYCRAPTADVGNVLDVYTFRWIYEVNGFEFLKASNGAACGGFPTFARSDGREFFRSLLAWKQKRPRRLRRRFHYMIAS